VEVDSVDVIGEEKSRSLKMKEALKTLMKASAPVVENTGVANMGPSLGLTPEPPAVKKESTPKGPHGMRIFIFLFWRLFFVHL